MKSNERSGDLLKFFIYLAVVVLINIAGFTMFFRVDLTSNKAYSLSDVSKKVVSTLEEPLTIYVFFTENLPAPYNSVEKYIHDLLDEYALSGNKYFNYKFYDVSQQEGPADEEVMKNQELASSYGIRPVQIQALEQDEVKFKVAYMGMVIIHGDMIERIPAVTSTDRLEYQLTTSIQKLNNKISTFQKLDDKIKLRLFLSSTLPEIAPFMGLEKEAVSSIPEGIEEIVERLNRKSFDTLQYEALDPSKDPALSGLVEKYSIMTMQWPDVPEEGIKAGQGSIGFIIEYKDRVLEVPLLERYQIPIFGAGQAKDIYQLTDMKEVEEVLQKSIESIVDINENLGYLADHGSVSLRGRGYSIPGMPDQGSISNFSQLTSKSYSIKEVKLTDRDMLEGLNCLVVAGPKEPFSDYELYQIDQFLMQGKSIAFFVDSFNEIQSRQGGAQYMPVDTGLDKLLNHWGINIGKSIVFDEESYRAQLPDEYGGGEQPLYYVPQIRDENISKELPFMKNIRGLLVQKSSPVVIDEARIKEEGLTLHKLFTSSEKSWEMHEPLNLNPLMMGPPGPDAEMKKNLLACTVEGSFTSYFAGKPVPAAVMEQDKKDDGETEDTEKKEEEKDDEKPVIDVEQVNSAGKKIDKGKPGKIFIIGTSEVLKNSLISPEGSNPNAVFMMNVIDYLNGHEDTAVMRGKKGNLNPLAVTSANAKSAIKYFNIIGLPVIVGIFGLIIWGVRVKRKRAIQAMFSS